MLQAAYILKENGVRCDILKLNVVLPVDPAAIEAARTYRDIVFVEETVEAGGIGEHFLNLLDQAGYAGQYRIRAIASHSVPHATVEEQLEMTGLDSASLVGLFL